MIDVSIVVPIYNAEKSLKKCIDSLVSQTKSELEFILVNDGSTDNGEKIIKSYQDKRIKYFKNKNQGIGKTRNFGIDKAQGKYIMFLDSDDFLDKKACEILFKKAEESNCDLVVCNYYRVIGNEKKLVKINKFDDTTLIDNKNILLDINLAPWNKIYKKQLIKENNIKFVENLKYEDAPFVALALKKAKKIGYIEKALNYYVVHKNSETTVRDIKVFDIIKIVDIIKSYFVDNNEMSGIVNELIVRILTNYNIQQRYQHDKKIAMEFIDKTFNYLKKEVSDYKNNKYYKNRSYLKREIEKSKFLTKLYIKLYMIKNKD